MAESLSALSVDLDYIRGQGIATLQENIDEVERMLKALIEILRKQAFLPCDFIANGYWFTRPVLFTRTLDPLNP